MSEHDGKLQQSTETGTEGLRARRFLALGLLVVAALFVGVVLGVLVAVSLSEREALAGSPTLSALETQLATDPGNEALKAALREEDRRLRRTYLSNRLRARVGAILLLVGVVSALLCARWYASVDPKQTMPSPLAERIDEDRWLGLRRRDLVAVAGAGGALVLLLLAMVFVGGASFPRSDQWTSGPSLDAVSQPPKEPGDALQPDALEDGGFAENWPRFRGPTGMGIVEAGEWPRTWSGESGENILWKTGVPMPGKGSPVIWGNRIFLTGADAEKQEVFCYRRDTGELIWRTVVAVPEDSAAGGDDEELEVFDDTGYAASTPATDGERVYAVFATADLAALSMNGEVVWSRNLGDPENMYGLATSLLVDGGLLLFQFDRGGGDDGLSALVAMDVATGETAWSVPRPVDDSWATPVVAETESGSELITSGDPWTIAYDPELGGELWRAEGLSGDVAASPVYADGMVYVTCEYSQTMAFRTGGLGDVTQTHVVWTSYEGVMPDAASPVCDGKYLFFVHSSGQMCCHDAETGEVLWEADLDSTIWASPTLVGRTVYLFGEDGLAYLLELGGEYTLSGTASLGEGVYGSPAFADSRIYVRGKDHLFCIAETKDTQ